MEVVLDERLARQIQTAVRSSEKDAKTGLVEIIVDLGGSPLTVRRARDTFSTVLGKARKGALQLIGRKREEMTVVMSLQDLVDVILVAAKPQFLGDVGASRLELLTGDIRRERHQLSADDAAARPATSEYGL